MKNKKNIYILLPSVLIVWGLIAYRIFAGIHPDIQEENATSHLAVFKPTKVVKKEGFKIKADYRDPFLGPLATNSPIRSKEKRIVKQKEPIVFPEIVYKGIFKPEDHSKAVFLIVIDGSQEMFKIRETHREVKLIKGDKEKIIVKYQTEKQTYFLKS